MTAESQLAIALLSVAFLSGCSDTTPANQAVEAEVPEYFLLRPETERAFGYSHAVKIGDAADEERLLRFGQGSAALRLYLRRRSCREHFYDRHGEVSRGLFLSELDLHEAVSNRKLARSQRPRPTRAYDRNRTGSTSVQVRT